MKTLCGLDCGECVFNQNCKGCAEGRLAENVLPPNAIKPAENPVFLPIKRA